MSDFEFMSALPIGHYIPTGSPLQRLDPRTRLLGGFLFVSVASITRSPAGLLLALSLTLVGLRIARIPLTYALRSLIAPLPFLLILVLLQILFTPPGPTPLFRIGPLAVGIAGLLGAGLFILRFAVLLLGINLIVVSLSTTEMVRGLEQLLNPLARLGLPTQDFVLIVQVTLHFLPFVAQSAERIAKAQASRGAEWGIRRGGLGQRIRQVLPLLVPIFLIGMRRAETMAMAMSARGYGSTRRRTSHIVLHWRAVDTAVLLLLGTFSVGILFL